MTHLLWQAGILWIYIDFRVKADTAVDLQHRAAELAALVAAFHAFSHCRKNGSSKMYSSL
jgi:hypothetical protein